MDSSLTRIRSLLSLDLTKSEKKLRELLKIRKDLLIVQRNIEDYLNGCSKVVMDVGKPNSLSKGEKEC